MLKEQKSRDTEPQRRWFVDDYLELFVWSDDGVVSSCQLCYDRFGLQRCISFKQDGSFEHVAVDDGEAVPTHNRTPVFVATTTSPPDNLYQQFRQRSTELPQDIRDFLTRRLAAMSDG
jgi:hypothetical protein